MASTRHCDVCGQTRFGTNIVTFSLRYELFEPTNGKRDPKRKHVSITGGSIDMCVDCWKRICKPRTRPRRRVSPIGVEDLFTAKERVFLPRSTE